MGRKKLGMHGEALDLPAPALAFRELAKLWLRKAFAAGDAFRQYKLSGMEAIDSAFMDASNDGVNHIYGFEGYKPPTVAFMQYCEGYVWCCAHNAATSNNPPFDLVQPLAESAEWRKRFVPKPQAQSVLDEGLDESDSKLLAALVGELSSEKRKRTEDDRIASINFVVAEITPRIAPVMSQLDKDRGFALANIDDEIDHNVLDSLLTQDEQELVLGDCYRAGNKVIREGMRGAYATAVANLKRAMFSPEAERQLSGIFWDTRESWVKLQHMHRIHRKLKQENAK